jgi:hypothetical protein
LRAILNTRVFRKETHYVTMSYIGRGRATHRIRRLRLSRRLLGSRRASRSRGSSQRSATKDHMRSAIPVTLFCGWLIPLLITAALYYGAMEYQQGDSRDGWDWFGLFAIAPYFFVVAGVLNLWILALRSRRKRVVFSFGLILPLVMLVLLVVTCGRGFASTPQGRLDEALSNLAKASSEEERFYALDDAAKASFEGGKIEDARKYAKELLS